LGSVVAMLAGVAVGAALLQWSPTAVIALAAGLVAAVAATSLLAGRHHGTGAPADRGHRQRGGHAGNVGLPGLAIETETAARA
jgi:uncharacterized membrane protein YfcA